MNAACAGLTNLFFPEPGDAVSATHAKQVCSTCDLHARCRETALGDPELQGIWGGLTQREREQIRARWYRRDRTVMVGLREVTTRVSLAMRQQ